MKIAEYYRSVGQEIGQRFEPNTRRWRYKRYCVYADIMAKGHLATWDVIRLEEYLKDIDAARRESSMKSCYTQTEDRIYVRVFGFEIIDKDHYKKCISILDDIIALLKAA